MIDAAAALVDEARGMFHEAGGRGPAPLRVSGWEVLTDIALSDGAEEGVGEGVEDDIGVAVSGKALVVRDQQAGQP